LKNKNKAIPENLFFILTSLVFVWPILMVIAISLTGEADIASQGYRLIPRHFDFTAYKMVFANPKQIIDAYNVTAFVSIVGTILAVFVQALMAYPLSRTNYPYRKFFTFFIFFTMLFGGGLVPSYILNTQYLKLGNNIFIYILPSLVVGWNIIIMRTFFQGIPVSLVESAHIDGCRDGEIFFRIILPLSKPVFATMALLTLLGKWNDWYTSLIYIRKPELYTLQYLLQRILREAEFVNAMMRDMPGGYAGNQAELPAEGLKFAMAVVATGPMLMIFPFFQKYFAKGLTVGAVKG